MAENGTLRGTVKWFSGEKGYGFIHVDGRKGAKEDVFVHFTQIHEENGGYRTLQEGQRVEFTLGHTEKGEQAENVVKLD